MGFVFERVEDIVGIISIFLCCLQRFRMFSSESHSLKQRLVLCSEGLTDSRVMFDGNANCMDQDQTAQSMQYGYKFSLYQVL